MAETSVAALEPRLQKQVESARIAYGRGNFDFTVSLCRTILREKPSCVSVRRLHRDAALRLHHGSGSPFALELGPRSSMPLILKPLREPAEEPLAALENAEEMIEDNPHSAAALRLLGRAAAALGWRETTIYAYEALHEESPRDLDALVRLSEAFLAAGRAGNAVASAQQALRLDATSDRALQVLQVASIAQPARSG
ncbi:MAG TPA: hypothetical protein VGM73_08520 [Candidatus Didemnitutus sp.]|jgi:tetratricopeptide (TPR) repeat protein